MQAKRKQGDKEKLEAVLHKINAPVKFLICSDSFINLGVIDDHSVKLVPLGIEQNGRVPEIGKGCEEVLEIEGQLRCDVVVAEDVLKDEHKGHHHPAEAREESVLADSPQDLHYGGGPVSEARCRQQLILGVIVNAI